MAFELTAEQRAILEAKGDVIISAAAGSGKTLVMTQKIADLVAQGTPVTDMLIVTFTKAATAEMKARIAKKLAELSRNESDEAKKEWLRLQAASVHDAQISTIDSFTADVVRRHFFELGLPQSHKIADDGMTSALLEEALSEAVGEYLQEHEDADPFSLFGSEKEFKSTVIRIISKMRIFPDGEEWLKRAIAKYDPSYDVREGEEFAFIRREASYILKAALHEVEEMGAKGISERHEAVYQVRKKHIQEILNAPDNETFCSLIAEKLSGTNDVKIGSRSPGMPAECNEAYKQSTKYYNGAQEMIAGFMDSRRITALHRDGVTAISEIVLSACRIFAQKKRQKGVLDFLDTEQFALRILRDTSASQVYRNRFRYVFVDEYQDTNPLQDEIIGLLLRNDNSFLVGDVKQSIYRFRDADPGLFLDKLERYAKRDDAQHRFHLTGNFRSSDAVVDFVNTIFRSVMTERTGGVNYDNDNALQKKRIDKNGKRNGKVDIHFIKSDDMPATDQTEGEGDSGDDITDAAAQARYTAQYIKSMMHTQFYDCDSGTERVHRFSDFAILMFSVKKTYSFFLEELSREGIPVLFESQNYLFQTLEVLVFMNLLRTVENKRQDLPLVSVMRSCVGGFTMEEVVRIRTEGRRGYTAGYNPDYYDCLRYAADKSGNKKVQAFLAKLERWQTMAKVTSMNEFTRMLMSESGFYRYVSVLPDGDIRSDNLDKVCELAENMAHSYRLPELITYFENQSTREITSAAHDAAHDAVTLVTEHKSKGLEYNAIIIPNLRSALMPVSLRNSKMYMNRDSIGFKLCRDGTETESVFYTINVIREQHAITADRLRLLYVALTRAKDSLLLLACGEELEKKLRSMLTKCGSFEDFILSSKKLTDLDILVIALNRAGMADALFDGLCDGYGENALYSCHSSHITEYIHKAIVPPKEVYDRAIEELLTHRSDEVDYDVGFAYSHPDAVVTPSKGSVTGFAHAAAEYDYRAAQREKQSTDNSGVLPTERGSATHLIFERIPLERHTEKSVRKFAESLIYEGFLSERELEAVSIPNIAAFFRRPMFERMLKSERLYREKEFICYIEARRVVPESESDELVVLQGVIDLCFIENGKWILLDYKTDTVNPHDKEGLKRKAMTHKRQLELYAYVLEKITHIPVAEAYISFVNAGEVLVFSS